MPVVAVDDIGCPAVANEDGGRLTKEDEPRQVVFVVAPAVAVDPIAVVERRAVDQIDGRPVWECAFPYRALEMRLTDLAAGPGDRPETFARNPSIERHHHAHVEALTPQCGGQRPGHIGEAARLRERDGFGHDKEDLHARAPRAVAVACAVAFAGPIKPSHKSLTLVCVGPVTIKSSSASRNG